MKLFRFLPLICLGLATAATARAEDHRERAHWHGDIHYFHEHDQDVWRKGHWFHGNHTGRPGWWWVVDGIWYSYPSRVAEIPDPYVPPTVTVQAAIPPPPPPPPPAAAPPPPSNWYYCSNPHGYYPYVTSCPGGWQTVAPSSAPPPGP